jgi:hypothetical protein
MKTNIPTIKKNISFALLVILSISCTNKNDDIDTSKNVPIKEDLIHGIVNEGNIDSYNALLFHYHTDISILPMAIYMSEQYNYGKACSDLFYLLYTDYDENTIQVDSMTREYMLYYLEKGINLNDTNSAWIMSKLYLTGTFVKKDSIMSKKTLMQVFSPDDVEKLYWPYILRHPKL